VSTTRDLVRDRVVAAFIAAVEDGRLPPFPPEPPVVFDVTRPASAEHGDFATNAALKMAGKMGKPPREIATVLAAAIGTDDVIAKVDVAGPGFVNIFLAPAYVERALDEIRVAGMTYGHSQLPSPKKINVEFVSANPTGPLHVGNARGAFVGDLLCRVLEAAGVDVTREYYFNDIGGQVERLGQSVAALKQGQPVPDDGYHGDYVGDLARDLPDDVWQRAQADPERTGWIVGEWASEATRGGIERSLENLGVHIDVWKGEGSLHSEGYVARAIEKLKASGDIYEQDGAQWFRSTSFGDEKDRVLVRQNGEPSYFLADIAYHREKYERGYGKALDLWGPDHHGHIGRLTGALEAIGVPKDFFEVTIVQFVRLLSKGELVKMSKRAGEFVTLRDLLDDVGPDAAKYFFLMRSTSTHLDFDLDLAREQSSDNPCYYVQYAHARVASLVRVAAEKGLTPPADDAERSRVAGKLGEKEERELLRILGQFPDVVKGAAEAQEPQRIPTYLAQVAAAFHQFYHQHRVVTDDVELSRARLLLARGTQQVIANGLALLGVSAPERM
jgi:arginyl-tRNA synthetase